jgi:hypothetical protein
MSAIELNARASATFAEKLAETEALLRQAAETHAGKITQANSLGAEDVVIAHLVKALNVDIPAFVLETGRLNPERPSWATSSRFLRPTTKPSSSSSPKKAWTRCTEALNCAKLVAISARWSL